MKSKPEGEKGRIRITAEMLEKKLASLSAPAGKEPGEVAEMLPIEVIKSTYTVISLDGGVMDEQRWITFMAVIDKMFEDNPKYNGRSYIQAIEQPAAPSENSLLEDVEGIPTEYWIEEMEELKKENERLNGLIEKLEKKTFIPERFREKGPGDELCGY